MVGIIKTAIVLLNMIALNPLAVADSVGSTESPQLRSSIKSGQCTYSPASGVFVRMTPGGSGRMPIVPCDQALRAGSGCDVKSYHYETLRLAYQAIGMECSPSVSTAETSVEPSCTHKGDLPPTVKFGCNTKNTELCFQAWRFKLSNPDEAVEHVDAYNASGVGKHGFSSYERLSRTARDRIFNFTMAIQHSSLSKCVTATPGLQVNPPDGEGPGWLKVKQVPWYKALGSPSECAIDGSFDVVSATDKEVTIRINDGFGGQTSCGSGYVGTITKQEFMRAYLADVWGHVNNLSYPNPVPR